MDNRKRLASFLIWPVLVAFVLHYFVEVEAGGNEFKIGDWLINYAGGMVRRGLIGSILFYVSDFGFPLKWLIFAVQVAFYCLIFFLTQKIYLMRERGNEWLLLLFSPAFLFFPFYDFQGGFRKEIMVFASFLVLAHSYAKQNVSRKSILASFVLFLLAVFSHELAVFTLPFFAIILFRSFRSGLIDRRLALVSLMMFSVAALSSLLLSMVFPGGADVARQICDAAVSKGFSREICIGAISWLGLNARDGYLSVIELLPKYVFVYPPLAVLAMLPLFMSDWLRKNTTVALVGLGFLSPLFVIASDWGRWLHIYVFFLFTLMLVESVWQEVTIRKWPIWALVLYLTVWSVPHYGQDRIRFGLVEKLSRGWNRLLGVTADPARGALMARPQRATHLLK